MMRKALMAATAAILLSAGSAYASVVTNIYSGYTTSGGGTPYSGFVGQLITPGVSFATDTGYNWHPFGLSGFGADVQGNLFAPSDGTYTFHLSSDDGALVFIDGSLLIDRGGPHGPSTTDGTLFLSGGAHTFEVQFFECCGGPSGLDFSIPTGVRIETPGGIPEPATWAMLIGGFAMTGLAMRARRKYAPAA